MTSTVVGSMCVSVGLLVCVCVCTSRAQTDYRLSRRRCRRLAASEAACRELLTPHRKCACQPVCVCACVLPFVLYEFS